MIKAQNNPDFTLASNGVTCLCPDADFGDTGTLTIDGEKKTFTKRTEAELGAIIDYNVYAPEIPLTCTSGITDMSNLFEAKSNFNQSLKHWDTSNVTSMHSMFFVYGGASAFNQDIGAWNTSKVTDMSDMFYNALAFNQDIGGWDTSKVTTMRGMFYNAPAFNHDIGGWDTSKVTKMEFMFARASAFNQDIGAWNTSKVTNMEFMFNAYVTSAFNQDIGGWDTSKVTEMDYMFAGATSFNQDISSWCVKQITSEPDAFAASTLPLSKRPNWGAECTTLSIAENKLENFKVYPNPAQDKLNLFWSAIDFPANMNVEIYSLNGKRLFSESYSPKPSELNVSQLASGVYLLKVNSGDQSAVRRIIKK